MVESRNHRDSIVKDLGLLKALTFMGSNESISDDQVKDVPFISVANLVSALLTELK